ncbi:MAG: FxsA family protein [Pseudomonadota bacterium]
MAFFILIAFIAIPIIEIAVFIQAGALIGLWPTIAIVILTAVAGTALMRAQGLQTLARAQQEMDQGNMPLGPLFDGLCLLIAGMLLLTPGFVTDTIGFLLLVPPLRKAIGAGLILKLMKSGKFRMNVGGRPMGGGPRGEMGGRGQGPIIDGDFEDLSNDNRPDHGNDPDENTGPDRHLPRN